MRVDWDYFAALSLVLGAVALAGSLAYMAVPRLVSRPRGYRLLVVLITLLVGGRAVWSRGYVVGTGRSDQLYHGLVKDSAMEFVRPGFWGGVVRWTEFAVRVGGGKSIYEKVIHHDDFDVDWRRFGRIEWAGDYQVRFVYEDLQAADDGLERLEVVASFESEVPPSVKEVIGRLGPAHRF
jgi:hypothetical protein